MKCLKFVLLVSSSFLMKYYPCFKNDVVEEDDREIGMKGRGIFYPIYKMNQWGWTKYLAEWGYGIVVCNEKKKEDKIDDELDGFYLIRGEIARNRALEGDLVCFEKEQQKEIEWIEPGAKSKQEVWTNWLSVENCLGTARITNICDRNFKKDPVVMVGMVEVESKQRLGANKRGVPYYRFKSDRTGDPPVRVASKARQNFYAIVYLDSWTVEAKIPDGHVERELGVVGTDTGEKGFLLARHSLLQPSWNSLVRKNKQVSRELATVKEKLEQGGSFSGDKGRLDLTHLPVFSIDPEGSKDLDDALHIVPIGTCGRGMEVDSQDETSGEWSVGIHIADVTSLFPWDGEIDRCARSKATSLYLDTVESMLPPEISDDAASLLEGRSRRAISLLVRVSDTGDGFNIKHVRCKRTLIKSQGAYSYEDVENNKTKPTISCQIEQLRQMIRVFIGSESSDNSSSISSSHIDSHQLVEIMMVWANKWVARWMWSEWGWGVFRTGSYWKKNQSSEKTGDIDTKTRTFLDVYRRDSACYSIIKKEITLQHEKFEISQDNDDSGLYCHYTSPIRRYADNIVHRLLVGEIDPVDMIECVKVESILGNLNRVGLSSRRLHREWTLWKWMVNKNNTVDVSRDSKFYETRGLVIEINPDTFTLVCYLPLINSIIHVDPIKQDWLEDYCQCRLVTNMNSDSNGSSSGSSGSSGSSSSYENDKFKTLNIYWSSNEKEDKQINLMDWVDLSVAVFPDRWWKGKIIAGL